LPWVSSQAGGIRHHHNRRMAGQFRLQPGRSGATNWLIGHFPPAVFQHRPGSRLECLVVMMTIVPGYAARSLPVGREARWSGEKRRYAMRRHLRRTEMLQLCSIKVSACSDGRHSSRRAVRFFSPARQQ
jgi:hypothetical protein